MEKEINIAEILKDKSKGLKLYLTTHGNCTLHHINDNVDDSICVTRIFDNLYTEVSLYGKFSLEGEVCLFPSKEMRDWEKFAWKKGDVLVKDSTCVCIFNGWNNDKYTSIKCKYIKYMDAGSYAEDNIYITDDLKLASQEEKNAYISSIEEHYGGKLNLETLEIEKPKQEFKDGDIVTEYSNRPFVTIFIFKKFGEYWEKTLSFYSYLQEGSFRTTTGWIDIRKNFKFRLATDEEKQRLFDALANKNKAWDADKKKIVDLPKKCEFKPKDWCLMCNFIHGGIYKTSFTPWVLSQYSHYDGGNYFAVGGNKFSLCIPYNDQTAHLLGTTDDWKGGEE